MNKIGWAILISLNWRMAHLCHHIRRVSCLTTRRIFLSLCFPSLPTFGSSFSATAKCLDVRERNFSIGARCEFWWEIAISDICWSYRSTAINLSNARSWGRAWIYNVFITFAAYSRTQKQFMRSMKLKRNCRFNQRKRKFVKKWLLWVIVDVQHLFQRRCALEQTNTFRCFVYFVIEETDEWTENRREEVGKEETETRSRRGQNVNQKNIQINFDARGRCMASWLVAVRCIWCWFETNEHFWSRLDVSRHFIILLILLLLLFRCDCRDSKFSLEYLDFGSKKSNPTLSVHTVGFGMRTES